MNDASIEARLPEALAVPLVLVLREGCTFRDAARKLGLPPEVIATRLREALRELRVQLIPHRPEP